MEVLTKFDISEKSRRSRLVNCRIRHLLGCLVSLLVCRRVSRPVGPQKIFQISFWTLGGAIPPYLKLER